MSKVIVGSKVLAGWFDTEDPKDWDINNMLEAMQKSILANVIKQTENCREVAAELQEMNEPLIWAYRELLNLRNEMMEMRDRGREK